MFYRLFFISLLSIGLVNFVSSDEVTKLEEFSSKTGVVTLVEYTSGTKHSVLGGSFEIQKRKVGSVSRPGSVKGVQVIVNRDRYSGTAFIDLDEINDLIEGIEYVMTVTNKITDLKNFEAKFTTVGGLSLTVFNRNDGSLSSSLQAGSYTVFPKVTELSSLLEDLRSARDTL
jgi:hypothetical protein